jgi:hypothetical protein
MRSVEFEAITSLGDTVTMKNVPVMIALGALAGALSYGIVVRIHSPWSEVIAALVIGAVPGVVSHSLRRSLIDSVVCAGGWLLGSLVFGVWMDAGVGAWLFAGALFGLLAGVRRRLWTRVVAGLVLGCLGGALAEFSRYATVLFEPLRGADMQLLLLVCAGVALSGTSALVTEPARRGAS